ncbi:MAG: M20/M25/M40 family metallo-hydrolase [Acidobacteriota bacterium]
MQDEIANRPVEGLAAIYDRAVRLLVDLCDISSPTGDSAGIRAVAERLAEELIRRGFKAEVLEETGAGRALQPILLARSGPAAQRHLLIAGHLDTVLPAETPRVDGDHLIATGASDMKGGFAAFVGALDLLKLWQMEPPADVLLVGVPDEEIGGPLTELAMQRWGQDARGLLVLEPGEQRGDGETVVGRRRGMFAWKLRIDGQGAHSGMAYWQGRSALAAAADWCLSAVKQSQPGPGPTVNVGRLVAGDATFVENLAEAHAWIGTSRQLNIVPNRAIAEGEARFFSTIDAERLLGELSSAAARVSEMYGVTSTFDAGKMTPPVDPQESGTALIKRATQLAAGRGMRLVVDMERGGISFPNWLPDPSRVPVLDGLGPAGAGMHARGEFVDLGSLRRRIVLLADLLADLRVTA